MHLSERFVSVLPSGVCMWAEGYANGRICVIFCIFRGSGKVNGFGLGLPGSGASGRGRCRERWRALSGCSSPARWGCLQNGFAAASHRFRADQYTFRETPQKSSKYNENRANRQFLFIRFRTYASASGKIA